MGGAETVTILFTDVVRSTATASVLDREAADSVRRTHFELLREALDAFGGREVKNLGDGIMAVFTSVGAAVTCAIGMQQRVERHARRAEIPVRMRVGISFGDATPEDGDYFGTPVIEAARLVAAADAGQILVPDLVRRLVGAGGPVLRPIGELALKGFAEPVAAAEVVWEALPADRELFALPPRLASAITEGFHGRGGELAALDHALDDVFAGHRRTVLIGGEPGIGKTRLSAELATTACTREAYVLYGRSEEGLGVPYQPVLEAMGHLVAHAPSELLEEYVDAHGGDLVRLVPDLAQRVPGAEPRDLDGDAERYALFGAVEGLLATAAADHPVVLVLDDLHWADRSTILLLRHVLTGPRDTAVLTILTFRSSDLPGDHPFHALRTDLHRHGGVETVELEGLAVQDVEALLAVVAGQRLDEADRAFVEMLHRETNGNPYFTREMLRHLVESGQLARTEGRWRATGRPDAMDLPGSVRDVLTQRVARLGAAATDVLTTASVIGRDVELDLLLLSIDQDEDELLDLLDAAVEARLLVETEGPRPGYTFAHALVEHTLYASLSQARRASRHRRVGEALERLCAGRPGSRIGELAHHWVRAGGADGEKALSYAIAAGDHAAAQVASQEAARWYASALQLLDESTEPDQRRRRDVLIGLGVAQRDSGEPGHRETLLKAARLSGEAHDAERLVRAALANSRGWVSASGQVDAERVAVLEAALATVGEDDRDSRERPLLLATLAAELAFSPPDVERRQMLADEALAAARRIGDALLLARVVSRSFVPTLLPERFDERLRSSAEGVAAAERAGDSVTLAHNLNWYAYALFEAGRMAEAGACWARQQELASELRQPTLQWQAAYNKAGHAIVLGHLDEAEQLAGDALQTGTASSQPDALPFYASQLISIRFDQGRLAEMQPFLAQTVEQNPGIPAFRSLLALASAEGDMDEEARRLLLDEAASDFSALPRDLTWINGIGIYALTCAHVEEAGPALALRAALVPFPDLVITSGLSWWGIAGHHIGNLSRVLGDHDASVEHLERASAAYARMETPVWMARVQLDTGRALVARGRKGDARRAENLRTQAEARARAVGSATLMRRAHELRTSARVTS